MILEFENVVKTYQQGEKSLTVLDELSLKIEKSQSIAILGKSGSGKSTFLSLGAGLDRPDSGKIIIQDENIVGMSEDELSLFRAKYVGIVFQHFHLMQNLSALENVHGAKVLIEKEKIDFLVTGHTHIEENLEIGNAHYVNNGFPQASKKFVYFNGTNTELVTL